MEGSPGTVRKYGIYNLYNIFFIFRNDDEYDQAIGTLLSIGASVLKVVGEKILEFYDTQQVISCFPSHPIYNRFFIKYLKISA